MAEDIRRQIYSIQDKISEITKTINKVERKKESLSKQIDNEYRELESIKNKLGTIADGSFESNMLKSQGLQIVESIEALEKEFDEINGNIEDTYKAERDNLRIQLDDLRKAKSASEKAKRDKAKNKEKALKDVEKLHKEQEKELERAEKAQKTAAKEKAKAGRKDFKKVNKVTGNKLGKIDALTGSGISEMAEIGGLSKLAGIISKAAPILLAVTAVVGVISKTVKLLYNTVKKNLPVVSKSITSRNRLEGKNINEQRTKGIQLIEKIKAAIDSIGEFLAGKLLDFLGAMSEGFYYVKDFFVHFGDYALAFLQDLPQAIYNVFVGAINLLIDQINNVLWVLDQIAEFFTGDKLGFRAPKVEYAKLEHVDAEVKKASERIAEEHAKSNGLDNALDTVSNTTLQQILTDLAAAVKDLGLTTKDAKVFANKVVNQAASLVNSGMFDNLKDASDALKDAILNENYSGLSGMGINDKNVLAMMTRLYKDYDYSGNTVYTESAMAGMREAAIEKLIGLSSEQLSALTEDGTILSNIEQGLAESVFGKETISGVNASSGTYDKNGNFRLETDEEVQNEIKSVNDYLGKILDKIPSASSLQSLLKNTPQNKLGKTLDKVWEEMEKQGKTHSTGYSKKANELGFSGLAYNRASLNSKANGENSLPDLFGDPVTGAKTSSGSKKASSTSSGSNSFWKELGHNFLSSLTPFTMFGNSISRMFGNARANRDKNATSRYIDDYLNTQTGNNSFYQTARNGIFGSLSTLWTAPQQAKNMENWITNKVKGTNNEAQNMTTTDKALYTFAPSIYGIKSGIDSISRLLDSSNKNTNSSSTKQQVDVKVTVSDNRTSATASYNRNVNNAMSSANTSRATSTRRR